MRNTTRAGAPSRRPRRRETHGPCCCRLTGAPLERRRLRRLLDCARRPTVVRTRDVTGRLVDLRCTCRDGRPDLQPHREQGPGARTRGHARVGERHKPIRLDAPPRAVRDRAQRRQLPDRAEPLLVARSTSSRICRSRVGGRALGKARPGRPASREPVPARCRPGRGRGRVGSCRVDDEHEHRRPGRRAGAAAGGVAGTTTVVGAGFGRRRRCGLGRSGAGARRRGAVGRAARGCLARAGRRRLVVGRRARGRVRGGPVGRRVRRRVVVLGRRARAAGGLALGGLVVRRLGLRRRRVGRLGLRRLRLRGVRGGRARRGASCVEPPSLESAGAGVCRGLGRLLRARVSRVPRARARPTRRSSRRHRPGMPERLREQRRWSASSPRPTSSPLRRRQARLGRSRPPMRAGRGRERRRGLPSATGAKRPTAACTPDPPKSPPLPPTAPPSGASTLFLTSVSVAEQALALTIGEKVE